MYVYVRVFWDVIVGTLIITFNHEIGNFRSPLKATSSFFSIMKRKMV